MMNITIIDLSGNEHEIDAEVGHSLMETIRSAGIDELVAMCGGCCACASCHVHIQDTNLIGERNFDEAELLEMSGQFQSNSRLSCQVKITAEMSGIRVAIASED